MFNPYSRNDTEVSAGIYVSNFNQELEISLMSKLLDKEVDEITETRLMNSMFEELEQKQEQNNIDNPFSSAFRGIDSNQFINTEFIQQTTNLNELQEYDPFMDDEPENTDMNTNLQEEIKNAQEETNTNLQEEIKIAQEENTTAETNVLIQENVSNDVVQEPKEPTVKSIEKPKTIESAFNCLNMITQYKEVVEKITQETSEQIKKRINELKNEDPSFKFKHTLFLKLNHQNVICPSTKAKPMNSIICRICSSGNKPRPNYKLVTCGGTNCLTCKYNINYYLCEKCLLNREISNHKFERVTTTFLNKSSDSHTMNSEKFQSEVINQNELSLHITNETEKNVKIKFKNTGTNKWNKAVAMEFTKDSDFRKGLICLPKEVEPNSTIELEIQLTELNLFLKGNYFINLRLQDKNKKFFGDTATIALTINK